MDLIPLLDAPLLHAVAESDTDLALQVTEFEADEAVLAGLCRHDTGDLLSPLGDRDRLRGFAAVGSFTREGVRHRHTRLVGRGAAGEIAALQWDGDGVARVGRGRPGAPRGQGEDVRALQNRARRDGRRVAQLLGGLAVHGDGHDLLHRLRRGRQGRLHAAAQEGQGEQQGPGVHWAA